MAPSSTQPPPGKHTGFWWLLLIASVGVLSWVLLRPGESHDGLNLVPLKESVRVLRAVLRADDPLAHSAFPYLLRNVGGNILAFFPLGFAVAGLLTHRGKWPALRRAVAVGFLFSLSIELLQLIVPLRITDVDDLLFNTLGAFLGGLGAIVLPTGDRRPAP
jgi:glycopeptide antibiotics resistance protein